MDSKTIFLLFILFAGMISLFFGTFFFYTIYNKEEKPTKFQELINAIAAAHRGKDKMIHPVNHHHYYTWDPERDAGWQEYRKARNLIYRYKFVNWILTIFRYI